MRRTMNEDILKMNIYINRYTQGLYLYNNLKLKEEVDVDLFIEDFMKYESECQDKELNGDNTYIKIEKNGNIYKFEFKKGFTNWYSNLNNINPFENYIYELCGYATFDINNMFVIFDKCDVFCNIDVMNIYNAEYNGRFEENYIGGVKNPFISPDVINKLLLKRAYPIYDKIIGCEYKMG